MIVEPLHRHPHLADALADRVHAEFGHHYDPAVWDLDAARREFEAMTDPAAHDVTWIAFDGPGRDLADVAGSVSLIADEDLPGFEHVTAWLANLLVAPDRRRAGVGRLLVTTVEDEARRRGLDRLHLFTEEQVGYYLPLGWRPLAEVPGGRGHVLVKRLDERAARRALASRWSTDPDVGGAYSYLRVGGRPEHRDVLAGEVLPGLVLAGEATNRAYPATLHGAWFSGERAARQLAGARRVLVVGAGIAGLVAARELAAAGSDVVVVERMPHIGGRARVDDSLGVTVPLGGAWFHGVEGHPLRELVAHRPDEWAYDHTVVVDHGWVAEPDLDAARAIRSDLLA
ncbi:MAG: GNAT family N-acetyltransferase, partial [Ilumatobacteraceae bacterium]|nr:GNAT family N-acetyltransferase [Ilumatobacteraceae bacterium]